MEISSITKTWQLRHRRTENRLERMRSTMLRMDPPPMPRPAKLCKVVPAIRVAAHPEGAVTNTLLPLWSFSSPIAAANVCDFPEPAHPALMATTS